MADTRIHGTTRQQVGKLFEQVERPTLQPLPAGLFPVFEEAQRTVHCDGYVEFKKAYYSAPPEYVGRQVWVRQEARLLRIHNLRREQIALHALAEPGKFTTDPLHLHSRKRHLIERGVDHLLICSAEPDDGHLHTNDRLATHFGDPSGDGDAALEPDLDRPAHTNDYYRDYSLRVTWQAAQQHKIVGSYQVQPNCSCFWPLLELGPEDELA